MHIPAGQTYKSPGCAYVEGDASSASYFLAGATITGGTVTVEACPPPPPFPSNTRDPEAPSPAVGHNCRVAARFGPWPADHDKHAGT